MLRVKYRAAHNQYMSEFESRSGDEDEIVDGPITVEEIEFLQQRGLQTQSKLPHFDTHNAFQLHRFNRPATSEGDPIVEKFNDEELRMLGPLLNATSEPPPSILDQLPYKKFDRQRVLRTAAEYSLYRGWLTLCLEASRGANDTTALTHWIEYLKEEGKQDEAQEIVKRMQSI
jgi:hypothetical protein